MHKLLPTFSSYHKFGLKLLDALKDSYKGSEYVKVPNEETYKRLSLSKEVSVDFKAWPSKAYKKLYIVLYVDTAIAIEFDLTTCYQRADKYYWYLRERYNVLNKTLLTELLGRKVSVDATIEAAIRPIRQELNYPKPDQLASELYCFSDGVSFSELGQRLAIIFYYAIWVRTGKSLDESPELSGMLAKLATFQVGIDSGVVTETDHKKRISEITIRAGQSKFKSDVLENYGKACLISGTTIESIVNGAHIHDYSKSFDNSVDNGLPLRIDLHTLYDNGLLLLSYNDDQTALVVKLHSSIKNDPTYEDIDGSVIFIEDFKIKPCVNKVMTKFNQSVIKKRWPKKHR